MPTRLLGRATDSPILAGIRLERKSFAKLSSVEGAYDPSVGRSGASCGLSAHKPPAVDPPVVGIVTRNSAHVGLPRGPASRNFAIRRSMAPYRVSLLSTRKHIHAVVPYRFPLNSRACPRERGHGIHSGDQSRGSFQTPSISLPCIGPPRMLRKRFEHVADDLVGHAI